MRYLVALLFLSACSPPVWTRADTTPQQYLRDKYECNRDSMQVNTGGLWQYAFFEECLESKGYTKKSGF